MPCRCSRLDVAQYCPGSKSLDFGAGRSAQMSSAFHALCDDPHGAQTAELMARLTGSERDEIKNWKRPEDAVFNDGTVLAYASASREVRVCIDAAGSMVESESEAALTGSWDMAWLRDGVVYVGDIKRQRRTTMLGCDSLQMHGYGRLACAMHGATQYCCGIWYAEEGEWSWGPIHDLFDFESFALTERILQACHSDPSEFSPGTHCADCWNRTHCREHLLDPEEAAPALAQWEAAKLTQDPSRAREALVLKKRLEDSAAMLGEQVKIASDAMGGIPSEDGQKIWRAVRQSGRRTLDRKKVEALLDADEFERCHRVGNPSVRHVWVKA